MNAEGRSAIESAEFARGSARKIFESCVEHGDPVPPDLRALTGAPSALGLTVPGGVSGFYASREMRESATKFIPLDPWFEHLSYWRSAAG